MKDVREAFGLALKLERLLDALEPSKERGRALRAARRLRAQLQAWSLEETKNRPPAVFYDELYDDDDDHPIQRGRTDRT
jgi:hypothetical protein